MALREMEAVKSEIEDLVNDLDLIDFDAETEPSDSASADDWREYALIMSDKLAEAEKTVSKVAEALKN